MNVRRWNATEIGLYVLEANTISTFWKHKYHIIPTTKKKEQNKTIIQKMCEIFLWVTSQFANYAKYVSGVWHFLRIQKCIALQTHKTTDQTDYVNNKYV